jgi:hypothetical protein
MTVRDQRILLKAGDCRAAVSLPRFAQETVAVPRAFDTFLIATRSGRVLGQAGGPPAPARLGDLAEVDNERKTTGGLRMPLTLGRSPQVLLAGEPHVLHVEQLTLGSTDLVVVAAVRSARLRAEQWVLPYWWVLSLAALLVLAGLSWPVLKLWFMGPSERLRNVDVRVLGVASLLVTAVVAVVVVGALTVWGGSRLLDDRMRDLATALEKRVGVEIDVARHQLVDMSSTLASTYSTSGPACPEIDCGELARTVAANDRSVGPVLVVDGVGAPRCRLEPNAAGGLTEWSGRTPCLSDRAYFRAARAGNLAWRSSSMLGDPFAVELVKSKLTGVDMLALAAPVTLGGDPRRPSCGEPMVMVVARHLTGFRRPVLPPGFSFAVIDREGRVQLHADSNRNLDENLFEEVADRRELQALLERSVVRARDMGLGQPVNLQYDGGSHRALIRPLPDGPWALVVLLDDRVLQAVLTEVIVRWAVCFMLFFTPGLLALGALQIVHAGYQAPWLWPSRIEVGTRGYVVAGGAMLVVAIGTAVAFGHTDGVVRGLVLFAVPWVVVALLYATLHALRHWGPSPAWPNPPTGLHERRFRTAYTAMIWVGLVALTGVPSALLWLDATDMTLAELDVAVERGVTAEVEAQRAEVRELCAFGAPRCPGDGELAVERATYPWTPMFSTSSASAPRPFSIGIRNLMPIYSDLAAHLRAVGEDDIRPIGTWFVRERGDITAPGLVLLPSGPQLLRAVTVFVAAWFVAMGIVWSVVTRLFLLDADRPDVLDAFPCRSRTTAMWLYRHGLEPTQLPGSDPAVLDLRFVTGTETVARWFKDHSNASHRVVIGLESRLGDPSHEDVLLDAFETQLATQSRLMIASSIDPLRRLEALVEEERSAVGKGEPQTTIDEQRAQRARRLGRWARTLTHFRCARIDVAPTGGNALQAFLRDFYPVQWPPAGQPTEGNDQMLSARNRAIWEQSTRRERVALRHLADEAFLSPADVETARSLFRRRLILRDGQIVFATRSFRRFVQRAASDVDVQEWEQSIGRSTWARVNPFLQGSLALVGAILLWTQEELRTTTVALPAAVTSALPLLVRLIGKLGSEEDASKSGK